MTRPIGLLDSGAAGLRVMAEMARRAPAEDLIYLADTARGPYRSAPADRVRLWTEQCAYFLLRFDPKVLVLTSYTAAVLAGERLRKRLPVPVFAAPGLLRRRGAAEAAGAAVAVVASEAALASGYYQGALSRAGAAVVCCPADPLLAALEQGDPEVLRSPEPTVRRVLVPALRAEPPVVAVLLAEAWLGLVAEAVREVVGPEVRVVEESGWLAEEVDRLLVMSGWRRTGPGPGERYFLVSGEEEEFRRRGKSLYGGPLGRVQRASPERFFEQMATLGGKERGRQERRAQF